MDDDFSPEPEKRPPPPDLGAPIGPGRGRPAMTPAQRELNDQKYESMKTLYEAMPQEARDTQFAIYEARNNVDAKRDPRHLKKIKVGFWKDNQLMDPNTLALYLEDKFGPGRYLIEPQDEHGQRILKFPFWCVSTKQFDEDAMDDEFDDDYDDRPRRRRKRLRYRDDEEDDIDDVSDRRSIADGLLMAQKVSSAGVGQAMNQSRDMMGLMMMANQENQRLAREDAVRREDARARDEADNRRREQERRDLEEKRRYDEDKRRDEERIRREDAIRLENQRRDDERREADRKHERDLAEARAASDRKMNALIGALPIILPVAERFLKPAQLPAPTTDPLSMMMAKSFLEEKRDRDPNAAVAVIVEATKLGSQLQTEQMRSAMQMQGELSKVLLAKALEQVNGSGSGKNMVETITELVTGAATLAEKLIPAKPAPNPYQQQAQQRIAQRPANQQAPTQQQPAQQQQAPAQNAQQTPQHQPGAPLELTEEQERQANEILQATVAQNPTYGVIRGLYAIQNKFYAGQAEYQRIIEYSVQLMPLDLRVAILDVEEATQKGDAALLEQAKGRVMELVLPTIQAYQEFMQWALKPDVQEWLQVFVPQLAPTIVAIFKASPTQQRDEYIAVLQAQAAQEQAAANAQANAPAPQESAPASQESATTSQETAPAPQEAAPVGDQALAASAPAETTPAEQAPVTAEIIQGPGSVPASSGSHLDPVPDV